ncbi:polygalacturonase inhibitor [Trifolium repens]|nr:polygalacturonase inhibitor [Trifolium repens]
MDSTIKTLVFHKLPNLTGPLQPTIAKLTNLKFLRITYTNLSGPVPSFLAELKKLTFLDLSFNNLTGSIPVSLSQLPIQISTSPITISLGQSHPQLGISVVLVQKTVFNSGNLNQVLST